MTDSQDFSSFGLDPRLLAAIGRLGYSVPTPIQVKAIPLVTAGRDVMGAAQTGTGKTAGYGLPLLQRILREENTSASPARHPVRALILAPTRELADQVNESLATYAADTNLRVGVVFGGVDIKPQSAMLRRGVEVLTATPGRLLDHIEQKAVSLSRVEVLVLDEADRMLDMGFLPDISRIILMVPKTAQNLMFSATFSPEIKKLAENFLHDPVLVEVARRNATADTIDQVLYDVPSNSKTPSLIHLLRTQGEGGAPLKQVIVFVNSKLTCRRLTRLLVNAGLSADSIHGDKTQDERLKSLECFKNGETHVLVATDVAARGLDITDLPCVINFDVPYVAEDYVHRIGRTGRAGQKGLAITLATASDDRLVTAIEELTKIKFGRKKLNASDLEKQRAPRRGDARAARTGLSQRLRGPGFGRARPAESADPIFDTPYEDKGAAPHGVRAGIDSVSQESGLGGRPFRLGVFSRTRCSLLGGGLRQGASSAEEDA